MVGQLAVPVVFRYYEMINMDMVNMVMLR